MITPLNTDVLIEHKIDGHLYLILVLLFQSKYDLLDDYLKATNTYETFKETLILLKYRDLLYFDEDYFNLFNYSTIKVNEKLVKTLGNISDFEELYNTFPVKVRRPDGKESFLKRDRKTSEQLYSIIIKSNQYDHAHIMKCLKYELEEKELSNSLGYMKTLSNWLSDREWRNYEDCVENNKHNEKLMLYGTTIE